jgi:DNA-binding phage protein
MKLRSYKNDLLKELKDPEYAAAYLAQALESGDQAPSGLRYGMWWRPVAAPA